MIKIGIVGSGAMGSGIAQVAAQAGHFVSITDQSKASLDRASANMQATLEKLVQKNKLSEEAAKVIEDHISYSTDMSSLAGSGLVIEAIVEQLESKKKLIADLDGFVDESCILGTNTSSLSVTAIASASKKASRVLGIHFFNPAPLMPLVEIIPALQSDLALVEQTKELIHSWGKTIVVAKDTPGFIVNRLARPYYGEALRMYEEGFADMALIDVAMREIGGFKMGPFELMDLIGNDVNYAVTESVFRSMYYDPRYKPSLTQLKLTEAGWLGRKTGRGYYEYQSAEKPEAVRNKQQEIEIFRRILSMLVNEAYDALYLGIASEADLDLAMTKGVNYPKGLISWGKEEGLDKIVHTLDELYKHYGEDRYRCSPALREASEKTEASINPFSEEIRKCVSILKAGGVILCPTDTIWGLGCDATNAEAVEKIYSIKKRLDSKSLIVMIDDAGKLNRYVREIPEVAWDLIETAEKPLTIVYPGVLNLAKKVCAEDGSAGIRVTKDEFCKQLIHQFGRPLVSTSANISGEPFTGKLADVNPLIVAACDHVVGLFHDRPIGMPSAIIKLELGGKFEILRR